MRPVSKWFYLTSIFGGLAGGSALSFLSLLMNDAGGMRRAAAPSSGEALGMLVNCFALVAQLYGGIVLLVLIYKMWAAIQGSRPRTTPGLAVGLLFIPISNLYWIFQVYWGWAKDYNTHVRRNTLSAPRMPEAVALVICCLAVVINVVTVAYFVGVVLQLGRADVLAAALLISMMALGLINFVLTFYFYCTACDGINAVVYRSARGSFGESKWSDACNICGAKLRGSQQARGLCPWCAERAA